MTNEKNDATDSLSHLFDGLLSTTCASINGTDGTITFSPAITGITSLRIHAQGKPGTGYFVVNGTEDYGNSIGDEVYQWITITGVSSLSTIFIRHVTGYSKTTVQAIEVNGVILTDGAAGDSLVDSPTNGSQVDTGAGGEVVGNYATLNPLILGTGATLANGNLDITTDSANQGLCRSTIGVSSGKWYFEFTKTSGADATAGICDSSTSASAALGYTAGSYAYYGFNGNKINNSSSVSYGASYGNNDVIGVALDMDAGTLTFYKNGVSQGQAYSGLSGTFFPAISDSTGGAGLTGTYNFGQRAFAYPLSGFKALCTTNLPTPTIADGSTAMDVALYTGNGSTQTISGLNFSPDLVWIKQRSTTRDHCLCDVVRGTSKRLRSNTTDAETTESVVTAFNSNGFDIGSDAGVNASSGTYVAWTWDAGSSTVTNTAGSITSQVRANASAGFSVVTYTGTSASSATVGHGLNVAPAFLIIKKRNASAGWPVWHSALTSTQLLVLNLTNAVSSGAPTWNSTYPTSTVFSIGADGGVLNNGDNYVAYCFAPVAGYSSFGSFSGGSNPNFVHLGFRPRFVMIKRTDTANYWIIQDAARNSFNEVNLKLAANASVAENDLGTLGDTAQNQLDFVSNGFVCRSTNGGTNASGGTFVYAAFAEHPFAYARAR
jgi:hypothetical protein